MINTNIAIAAVVILGLVGFGVYKLKRKKIAPQKEAVPFITDEGRYKEDTWLVEHYIQQKDWEMLENMLNSSTKDFPDLIEKIQNSFLG